MPAPFDQPYLLRAVLELVLIAPIAGALGVFAILRRQVFTAHAVGVGALPGIVLAAAAGLPVLLGGLGAGALFAALAIRLGVDRRRGDAAATTGVLLAGAIGIGAALISAGVGGSGVRLDGLLFGSLLGVTDADLARAAVVAAVAGVTLLGLQRVLTMSAFDRDAARAGGLRVARYDLVLGVAIALVVVVAVEAVGALLASALVVLPAAAALRLTRRVVPAMALAAAIAVVAAVVGLLVADRLSLPPGATVVLAVACAWPIAELVRAARARRPGRRSLAVGLAVVALIVGACGGTESAGVASSPPPAVPADGAPPLRVVATTPIVADWASAVGGDAVEVTTIVPAGADAHDFEPTPDVARAIADADVVLASGAGLDGWVDQLVEGSGGDAALVELAPASSLLPLDASDEHADGHDHGHDEGGVDPHYWHDPMRAIAAVDAIQAAFAKADPARADRYAQQGAAYAAELEALDAETAALIDATPPDRRRIVTDHDAFAYLADRYGIEVVGTAIPSTSGAASVDAQTLADLIELIRETGVTAVYAESTSDPSVARVLADETGARLVDGLYADTLGPAGDPTGTYIGMMRANAQLIARGLKP